MNGTLEKIPHSKVVLCGSSSVGKTTILQQILKKELTETPCTTMGVGFASVIYTLDNYQIPLNIWDTAGQEAYRSLVNIYFRNVQIALIVFDVTSHQSFEAVSEWVDEVRTNCGDTNPIICVVGNKIDKNDQRIIQSAEAKGFADICHYHYLEVSAIKNQGIDDLMSFLAHSCLKLYDINQNEKKTDNDHIIDVEPEKSNSKCC